MEHPLLAELDADRHRERGVLGRRTHPGAQLPGILEAEIGEPELALLCLQLLAQLAHAHSPDVRGPGLTIASLRRLGAPWNTGDMRVHLGSDHAGWELKSLLVEWLVANGHEPVDHGPERPVPDDDYPVYCVRAAAGVAADRAAGIEALGVVIGGSGNGEQMSANKVRGIRAALAWSEETARLAREHNDAQVVAIGARMHSTEEALGFVCHVPRDAVQRRPPARASDRTARDLRGDRRTAATPGRLSRPADAAPQVVPIPAPVATAEHDWCRHLRQVPDHSPPEAPCRHPASSSSRRPSLPW